MGIIVSIIVGGCIGWLASLIVKSPMGILGYIVIGIIGSALGHYVAGVIGLAAYGPLARLAVSVGGAVLLIGILRFFGIM
jgi:uncharacterized membrane protein YeaQ/YmgE (transglycosylase-associated protein family)